MTGQQRMEDLLQRDTLSTQLSAELRHLLEAAGQPVPAHLQTQDQQQQAPQQAQAAAPHQAQPPQRHHAATEEPTTLGQEHENSPERLPLGSASTSQPASHHKYLHPPNQDGHKQLAIARTTRTRGLARGPSSQNPDPSNTGGGAPGLVHEILRGNYTPDQLANLRRLALAEQTRRVGGLEGPLSPLTELSSEEEQQPSGSSASKTDRIAKKTQERVNLRASTSQRRDPHARDR